MKPIIIRIITALIMVSLLAMALVGLTAMLHEPDGGMAGDCPFSAMGASLCPQDALAELAHHVSAYRAFFNVTVDIDFTVIVLLFVLVAFLFFELSPPLRQPVFVRIDHGAPPPDSYQQMITRWLSRFENSPSHA